LLTEKEIFTAICQQSPDSIPVFMQCWWLNAVCEYWDVAVTLKGNQVTGVWPYAIEEKASITFRRNPRLTPYMGPHIFYPADIKEANKDSYEHEVIEQLMSKLPDADIWGLSQYPGMKQAGLFRNYGLKIYVQQTFLLSLEEDEQTLFQNFKEQLRRNIKHAEKDISITQDPTCLPELYEFQRSALFQKRVAQPHTLADMEKLLKPCMDNNAGVLWVARQHGVVQALAWNVWDAHTSYYIMGAKNPAADDYRAMSLLLWHAILEAKRRGNKVFDFEGSMDPGVERFFRNFGGRRELYLILRKDSHWFWKLKRLIRG
jgi:hypothetical protein